MIRDLDIYCLTRHRNLETINRFLDRYVDRAASESRGKQDLLVVPLGRSAASLQYPDYEREPALVLTHCIQLGLDYPRRAFAVGALKSSIPTIAQATLAFTVDDQLVLGLALDDTEDRPETVLYAKELLHRLADEFDCHLGLIAVEQAPPLSEEEFRWGEVKILICRWERQ